MTDFSSIREAIAYWRAQKRIEARKVAQKSKSTVPSPAPSVQRAA